MISHFQHYYHHISLYILYQNKRLLSLVYTIIVNFFSSLTGWFDSFYENTDAGQWLEENSYGFDTVRAVGTGVGYVVGVVALTILTCGIFGVATGGVGAAGAATSTASTMSFQTMMGLVAGYAGFGKGAEQAWGNGADLGEGLVAALATGVWEGFQMWAGAQIGAPNGWGTQLASKVVGSNANVVVQKVAGSVARLLLDTVDGAVEGFVVPAIDTIYADGYIDENGNYIEFTDDDGLFKRYTEVFDDAGGWKNVGIQGMVGFATSFAGEVFDWIKDARKFNSNANDVDINRMDNPKVDISEAELQTKINRYRELEAIINSEEYILYMDNVKKMYAQELRFDFEGLEKEFADLGNELAKYTDVNSIKQVDMDDKPDIDISITEDIDISVTGDIDISVTEDIIGDVSSKIDAQESKNVLSDFKNLIETGKKSDSHVVDLMHKTFSDAFDDGNTEALAVLKMFNELKRNNQDLRVLIAPDSSKCYYNVDSKTIFIGKKHIDMSDTCTFAHELGHCLYDNIFGDEVPYNWRLISENAREISSFNTTMTNFCSNLEDISSHTRYLASREFEQDIKVKYGSLDKYRQRLTTKYSIKLKFMSEDKLRSTLKTFRYSNKDIDFMVKQFSDGSIGASELAGMQILYSKNVIKDRIFRTEYGDYCALSDIIDAVYGGTNTDLFGNELHLPYVHGFDYYTGDYTKLVSFHEIIANYTQLKITGNATSLEILKSIFGSEFSNCLEDVFSKFSYYG